ncbi:MAG: IS200/IS605 family transposase [Actinomycetota bacterium]|nr:IS200/IS605 family transposase [Actinomycetota bacterium]
MLAVWECHVHLVFVTKYRRGALTKKMLVRCEEVMADVCADFGRRLAEFNAEDDHIHLLVEFPPTVQLSALVNSLKGVSARRLRQEFPAHVHRYLLGGNFSSRSYYVGTKGGAPLSVLAKYVESQRQPGGDSSPA